MIITRLYLRNYRVFEDELDLALPSGLVGIYGANGAGKCLPGSTPVWDADAGRRSTIEEFVRSRRSATLGLLDGVIQVVPVVDWLELGEKPTYMVSLSSGTEIEVAASHPILTDKGCVRAEDLTDDHWVAEARHIPQLSEARLSVEEAMLLGLLLGDGTITTGVRLSAKDPDVVDLFRRCVEAVFPGATTRSMRGLSHIVVSASGSHDLRRQRQLLANRLDESHVDVDAYLGVNAPRFRRGEASPAWETLTHIEREQGLDLWPERCALHGGRAAAEWVHALGFRGTNSFTKHVPDNLLTLPRKQVLSLLAGLWLTDGYVGLGAGRSSTQVSYTSRSQQLARDVRTLLLRIGVQSVLRTRMVHGKPCYTVVVLAGSYEGLADMPLVGVKGTRLSRLLDERANTKSHPLDDLLPPRFNSSLPRPSDGTPKARTARQLAVHAMSRQTFASYGGSGRILTDEIRWSRIRSVQPTGRQVPCFDITVDTPDHLYLADNVIVHNSAMIESIRFALFGKARTSNDEIRTSGINDDCIAEVEFEHEGHLYLVRRTISGVNSTIKAAAHWNGQQVAEGVRDVTNYVHSVLGMDDAAFRASVFAEQKQVAAFSAQGPQKRRELVLRLLGITPLDKARDAARADARSAKSDHERLAARLPDLEALTAALDTSIVTAEQAAVVVAQAETALATLATDLDAAEVDVARLSDLDRTWTGLMADGRTAAAALKDAEGRVVQLTAELTALADARTGLAVLRSQAEGLDPLEGRVRELEVVAAARAALAALPATSDPPVVDEASAANARAAATDATADMAEAVGALRAAEAELVRTADAAARSADLAADEDCPVCGQALGTALSKVRKHRAAEVAAATKRVTQAKRTVTTATKAAKAADKTATVAEAALTSARQEQQLGQQAQARRGDVEAALATALANLDTPPVEGELDHARVQIVAMRKAGDEATRLEGRLERLPTVEAELAAAHRAVDSTTGTRDALREKVKALGYAPEARDLAIKALDRARATHRAASTDAERARLAAASATATVTAATTRLDDARILHGELHELAEQSRHLGRLGDLLSDFRNNVVAVVGPRLATQAAELFAELTDHDYDRLEVDADTYEIKITDAGRTYGMDRFSGSETDLANLALRVAISEHVRFQSGGSVGLLVLDEVFGPLDDDRKERMLLALERLRGRFRQVLVVTHDTAIKEQLPGAVLVQKLPGRRATATVMGI